MEFKKGFKIKPKLILETGEVVFTDGTNDVFANELSCKEYGYNYDTTTGTCYAYRYNNNLNKRAKNLDNKVLGIDNNINQTKYSLVNGTKNTTRGVSVNCFIIYYEISKFVCPFLSLFIRQKLHYKLFAMISQQQKFFPYQLLLDPSQS